MRDGRRSTISSSVQCSMLADALRSKRLSRLVGRPAGASSKSVWVPGISLPEYARKNRLVGVDLSEPMLRKAHERVAEYKLTNVETLAVMDAERMALPDRSFDVVVAQFVITAVPKPEATLDEFRACHTARR